MTGPGALSEYRIEDLAHASGATVRTIRAYQDRGLLPTPERRGRANVYRDTHLARLRQIAGLLDRGYTLASIKELLEAWDTGRGLGGVLGLVSEVDGPWTGEETARITRAEPAVRFGGRPDDAAVDEAVALGRALRMFEPRPVLVPVHTVLAIQKLVGAENVAAFVVAAAEREVQERTLDSLAPNDTKANKLD